MSAANQNGSDSFSRKIGDKERRKLKGLRDTRRSVWFGLGTFGIVGWSVVIPTVLGTALGIWLDKNYPQTFSWTLTCLITGLFGGCFIAWNWIDKENKEMHHNGEKNE